MVPYRDIMAGSKRKRDDASRRPGAGPEPGSARPKPGRTTPEETAAKGPDRPSSMLTFDWWRENLEAFIFAVVLAIIIRHFSVEAFEIPTGSMATTLLGMHAKVTCPNCATEYPVALQSDSSTGELRVPYQSHVVYEGACPNPKCSRTIHVVRQGPGGATWCGACGTPLTIRREALRTVEAVTPNARCPICHHVAKQTVVEKKNRYGGHKILVTKFAYVVGSPKRWDVVVFEFDQWKNYIKRLVGLPRERIQILDGDLYVNGEGRAQVHGAEGAGRSVDEDLGQRRAGERLNDIQAWGELAPKESRRASDVPKNAAWDPALLRWKLNAAGDLAVLRYQRPIDNFYSYNLLGPTGSVRGWPPGALVGDRKVAFTARVSPPRTPETPAPGAQLRPGWIGGEIRDGDFTFQLRIPLGTASEANPATLTRLVDPTGDAVTVDRPAHESGLRVARAVAIRPDTSVRIELENVDDRVAARIDGVEVLAIEYTSHPGGPDAAGVQPDQDNESRYHLYIIASNALAELSSIRAYRDMYYIPKVDGRPWEGIQLGRASTSAWGTTPRPRPTGATGEASPRRTSWGRRSSSSGRPGPRTSS